MSDTLTLDQSPGLPPVGSFCDSSEEVPFGVESAEGAA